MFYVNKNWPGSQPNDTHFKALMNQARLACSTRSHAISVETKSSTLKVLPAELMINIVSYCNIEAVWTVCSLVNKTWKALSRSQNNLWVTLLQKDDLSYIEDERVKKTLCDSMTNTFLKSNQYEFVFAIFEKYPESKAHAFIVRIFKKVFETKNYSIAKRCLGFALSHENDIPHKKSITTRLIEDYVTTYVREPNFLEISDELINDALFLRNRDIQSCFCTLMKIVERFVDLQKYTKVNELIKVCHDIEAESPPHSMATLTCMNIGTLYFKCIGHRLFHLNQFALAEQCMSYTETPINVLFANYFNAEFKEGQVNEFYFSKIRDDFSRFEQRAAHEKWFFHLIKTGDTERINEHRKKIIDHFDSFSNTEKFFFKIDLRETGHAESIALFENLH